MTSERFEQARLLETVFMPYASRQRDELRRKQSGWLGEPVPSHLLLVHYTSAEAALSIIRSKRFWMRNCACMSDYREIEHGFDILRRCFDNPTIKEFSNALDACVPGAADKAFSLFNGWWADIRFRTHVASFSEHQMSENEYGRLSMWRAFGGNATRVALVVRIPWYSEVADALNMMFSPVAYLDEPDVRLIVREVIQNIRDNSQVLRTIPPNLVENIAFNMLVAGVTCVKHKGFEEEREWRAIYTSNMRSSDLVERETHIVGGVHQHVFKIPLDKNVSSKLADIDFSALFERLIIGPTQYPVPIADSFSEALSTAGIADAASRIRISSIPIRT